MRVIARITVVVAAIAASLVVPRAGFAQNLKTGLTALAASGRTIAGPGVRRLQSGNSQVIVWFNRPAGARATRPACITALNLGPGTAKVMFANTALQFTSNASIPPGNTDSACENAYAYAFECFGGDCSVVWRIDAS